MRARSFLVFLALSLLFFSATSCGKRNVLDIVDSPDCIIDLSESVYWAQTDAASSVYSTALLDFEKLDTHKSKNLQEICGMEGAYVWLKIEFTVPNPLKYRSLGFVVSSLRFADKVWLNNSYIGSSGKFPPNEKGALFMSHFYFFPDGVVKNNEVNTILIKVWAHGRSEVSDEIFISDYDTAYREYNRLSFQNSKMYLIFQGAMFCSFVLYFMMYIWRRKNRSHLAFSLLNLCTIFFLAPFLAPEIPFYLSDSVSYLLFMKLTLCVSFYFLITFVSYFIIEFLHVEVPAWTKFSMYALLLVPTAVTLAVPSYNHLMSVCKPFLLAMFVQLGFALKAFFSCLFKKEKRRSALFILFGFSPVLIAMLCDVVMRGIMKNTANPYFSIFGWQLAIIMFIIILSMRYNKVYAKNEYLTTSLKKEVAIQTQKLTEANESLIMQSEELYVANESLASQAEELRSVNESLEGKSKALEKMNEVLEREMVRKNQDLEMAAIVQQKFFPPPDKLFRGWDVAICYQPAAKVSGDLYDYYTRNECLEGLSIFDVSGHGIAAGLITMLSKRIIFNTFKESLEKFKSVSNTLYKVNEQILDAKGDIENYLTGILLHFADFDEDDACSITMANAGHPHPILYSSVTGLVSEVVNADVSFNQYGAIGIKGIAVSFPEIKFKMVPGDVFVCFTDGLVESFNSYREEYGTDRLKQVLSRSAEMDAQSILEEIIDDLMLFSSGVPREDDLTIIVLKRKKSSDFIEEILEEL